MSETNNYPNFYKPAEGQPPLEEEQLAETSQAFNGLFDDLMLQGMDSVEVYEDIKDMPVASLIRKIEVDGQQYTLALNETSPRDSNSETNDITFRDSETITRDISLQRISEGYGREYWSYRLGADGTVRRWDGGDFTAKRRKNQELGIEEPLMQSGGKTREEIKKLAHAAVENLLDQLPNDRLEEDMGLNNQPVAADEIYGLQEFLTRATDIPK